LLRTFAFVLLTLAVLAAGCTQPPPESGEDGALLPLLESYRDCPWVYPDNTTHDCDSTATAVTVEMTRPVGWVCTAEDHAQGWSLHWNPATNERGIWYDAPENASGHTGVMHLRTAGTEHLFQWDHAPSSAFLHLGVEFGDTAAFGYEMHTFGYATNGTLAEAQGTPLWSLHDGQFWVVHRFDTHDGTYTFQNMTAIDPQRETNDGNETHSDDHVVRPFEVIGQDFALWVHHERSHLATSQGNIPTDPLGGFCQSGL
jgi:hypothetical protein